MGPLAAASVCVCVCLLYLHFTALLQDSRLCLALGAGPGR